MVSFCKKFLAESSVIDILVKLNKVDAEKQSNMKQKLKTRFLKRVFY